MSESSTEATAPDPMSNALAGPPLDPPKEPEVPEEHVQDEEKARLVAESRKWEKRAKENAAAAKQLAEIEDAKKSEIERATTKQQRAEAERDEAVAKLLRYEVAAATGIPSTAAHRLQGSSREELEADARELAKLLADKKEAERKETLVDPSAGRGTSAGSSTADQFAAMFNK